MTMLPCHHSGAFSSDMELTKFNLEFTNERPIQNLPKNLGVRRRHLEIVLITKQLFTKF